MGCIARATHTHPESGEAGVDCFDLHGGAQRGPVKSGQDWDMHACGARSTSAAPSITPPITPTRLA